jgi:hypothetical protein
MFFFRVTLLLLGCHHLVSAIPLVRYQNAQFIASTTSEYLGLFNVQSQNECACYCFTNEICRTASYFGINNTCLLFSAKVQPENLRLTTLTIDAAVLTFQNRTVQSIYLQFSSKYFLLFKNFSHNPNNHLGQHKHHFHK